MKEIREIPGSVKTDFSKQTFDTLVEMGMVLLALIFLLVLFINFFLFMFLLSQRFTSLPNSGATRSTSTFQEERLCLTIMRQSYQPTGTHRFLRSVSV